MAEKKIMVFAVLAVLAVTFFGSVSRPASKVSDWVTVGAKLKPIQFVGYTKPKFEPTEIQSLRLQIRQRDAQIAQKDLFTANQRFQLTLGELQAEAQKIKTENKWPADVRFNPDTLVFEEPPKPAEPPKKP
jgi:hypothetical protein